MTTRTTFLLLGIGVGAVVLLIRKAAGPLGAYAIAGGMIAYETACDAIEYSGETLSASTGKIRRRLRRQARKLSGK